MTAKILLGMMILVVADTRPEKPNTRYNKGYKFNYSVLDSYSGNDYFHKESSDGNKVDGQYDVLLPDGRKQKVKYTADHNGYFPEVKYEINISNQPVSSVHRNPHGHRLTPVRHISPIQAIASNSVHLVSDPIKSPPTKLNHGETGLNNSLFIKSSSIEPVIIKEDAITIVHDIAVHVEHDFTAPVQIEPSVPVQLDKSVTQSVLTDKTDAKKENDSIFPINPIQISSKESESLNNENSVDGHEVSSNSVDATQFGLTNDVHDFNPSPLQHSNPIQKNNAENHSEDGQVIDSSHSPAVSPISSPISFPTHRSQDKFSLSPLQEFVHTPIILDNAQTSSYAFVPVAR